jgi:hypothetical protein
MSEGSLERSVPISQVVVGAKRVAERQVAAELSCFGAEHIQVMGRLAGRRQKGFAAYDTEVTLVNIADAAKKSDGFGKFGWRCEYYVEIDDGFGGEARDRCAADVFDRYCETAECGLNSRGQF